MWPVFWAYTDIYPRCQSQTSQKKRWLSYYKLLHRLYSWYIIYIMFSSTTSLHFSAFFVWDVSGGIWAPRLSVSRSSKEGNDCRRSWREMSFEQKKVDINWYIISIYLLYIYTISYIYTHK
jgi:hypothetical protein